MSVEGDKLLNQQLGSYKITEAIGQGGMARVYKGYHLDLNRYAAIKVIAWGLAEDKEFTERFRREAQAIAGLRHPHIVTIYDFGQYDQGYYMVMEYIEGEDLEHLIAQGEPIPPAQIQRIISHIAGALDHAHNNGVVHRDIKPSNIMMASNGQAILTDFGLVMLPNSMGNTTLGNAFGTPYYIAPEQAVSSASAVPASDIYSLGVILFELLAGTPPYMADSPLGIALKHVSDPIPSIHDFAPDIPDAIDAILKKALAKEPTDRFASATEMAQTLARAWDSDDVVIPPRSPIIPANVTLPDRQVMVPPPSFPPIPTQPPPVEATSAASATSAARSQTRILGGIIIVLILIILTAGVWFSMGGTEEVPTPTQAVVIAAATNTPTLTPSPKPTQTNTPTAEPTHTPTATPTLPPTHTPTLVPTNTSVPTDTPSPSPSPTLTLTPTITPEPVFIPTNTPDIFSASDPLAALRGKILFKTDRSGRVEIYQMDEDGSNQKPLPPEFAYLYNEAVRWEAFSPDRSGTIVVRGEGQLDLWWVKTDGSGELRITTHGAADYDPVWSPIDNRILFVSERTGNGDLYLLSLDGSGRYRLTINEGDFDKHPSWSPDGTKIVYWSNEGWNNNWQIWRIDIGTNSTVLEEPQAFSLSNNPFRDWDPVWVK